VSGIGRLLVVAGVVLAAVGVLVLVAERFGVRVGRLPGDVAIERGNFRFYFPLATSILASVVLTLVLWLLGRR
jgi:DUF2905 family protein